MKTMHAKSQRKLTRNTLKCINGHTDTDMCWTHSSKQFFYYCSINYPSLQQLCVHKTSKHINFRSMRLRRDRKMQEKVKAQKHSQSWPHDCLCVCALILESDSLKLPWRSLSRVSHNLCGIWSSCGRRNKVSQRLSSSTVGFLSIKSFFLCNK